MRAPCALGLCFFASLTIANYGFAQSTNATTDDGRAVTLFDNGTWKYKEQPEKSTAKGAHFRPADSTEFVASKKGFLKLWYNPQKWKVKSDHFNKSSEFEFEHEKGDAYAIVIVERMAPPLEGLRKAVTDLWLSIDKDSKIVFEEQRSVNGISVLVLQDDLSINGIAVRYYGYFWSGKEGDFQVTVYTSQNLFEEYAHDFTDLLDGVTITKK